MDDETYNAQKARIQKLIDRWVEPLGLNWWELSFRYVRVPGEKLDGGWQCIAETSVQWQYLHAIITFWMPVVVDEDDDELEESFVHELTHVLVQEMRETASDQSDEQKHVERVVETLSRAFRWVRKAGYDEGVQSSSHNTLRDEAVIS